MEGVAYKNESTGGFNIQNRKASSFTSFGDANSDCSIAVRRPEQYYCAGAHLPPVFQQPLHLTSFSYSPTRQLLTNEHDRDQALAFYNPPGIGVDLNVGFESCNWRNEMVDEGLDSLLTCLVKYEEENLSAGSSLLLDNVHLVTWRGMMTKLLLAVYEVEGTRQGPSDGWEMNAMVLDGVLYLEDAVDPMSMARKKMRQASYLKQTYYGYSFEAYSTGAASEQIMSPNTNVQWCSVVKTNLGGVRTILGGEVDCVSKEAKGKRRIDTKDFIELKTNIAIGSQRDEVNFEKTKLLKHYIQSFLLGVPLVVVGFRTREGVLTALQEFKTLEIPRLVRGKRHAWDPLACLASGRDFLGFIRDQITSHGRLQAAENQLRNIVKECGSSTSAAEVTMSSDLTPLTESYPVFRVTFNPKGQEGEIKLRCLNQSEIEGQVWAGKTVKPRVGFLPASWVKQVIKRRGRIQAR